MDPSAEAPNSDAQALTKAPAHVLLPPPPRRDIRHRGPGLTLIQLSKNIGDFIEPLLNLFFRPFNWRRYIEDLFGDDADRETALDELHGNPHCSSGRLRPLERYCHELLKLARPKSTTVETQLITFKNVVALITRYPGIRRPLHAHKDVQKALATDPSLSSLWNRPHLACGEEWAFYRNFAAFCISDNAFAITELLEAERPSGLGRVELSGNLDRVPIETLLGQSRDGPEFHLSRLCAIRYLAGILELPSFWRQFPSNTGAGRERQRFIAVLSDLCGTVLQLIRDTEGTAPDIIVVFPSSMVAGRMAVDVLSCSLLNGLLQMKHLNNLPRRVPAPLPTIVSILLRDDRKTFPRAVNPATQVAVMLESSKYDGTDSLLDENEAQLDENEAQLDENEAQLHENEAQLDENKAQLHENEAQLDENEAQLKEVLEVFAAGVGGQGGAGPGPSISSLRVIEQRTPFSSRLQVSADLEIFAAVGGQGGASLGPFISSPLVSIDEDPKHKIPAVKTVDFCKAYGLDDDICERLIEEGYDKTASLLVEDEWKLQKLGFRIGHIAELRWALKKMLLKDRPESALRNSREKYRPSLYGGRRGDGGQGGQKGGGGGVGEASQIDEQDAFRFGVIGGGISGDGGAGGLEGKDAKAIAAQVQAEVAAAFGNGFPVPNTALSRGGLEGKDAEAIAAQVQAEVAAAFGNGVPVPNTALWGGLEGKDAEAIAAQVQAEVAAAFGNGVPVPNTALWGGQAGRGRRSGYKGGIGGVGGISGGHGGEGGAAPIEGGEGGTGEAPDLASLLLSIDDETRRRVPDTQIDSEALDFDPSLIQRLQNEGFRTVGGLFETFKTDLVLKGFEPGHVSALKAALVEIAAQAKPN